MAGTRVALIRGINFGHAKRVAMADLRRLFETLGDRDVRTLANSGNVVFTGGRPVPPAAASRLEKKLPSSLGDSARITVLTAAELASAAAGNPLLKIAGNPSRLLVAFLNGPAHQSKLKPLAGREWGVEALAGGQARGLPLVPRRDPSEPCRRSRRPRARRCRTSAIGRPP